MPSAETIALTIDGQTVEVAAGTTLWEAARQAGIAIPVLCHHPNLDPVAVCRVCVGIGMGGEWASGSTLVAETLPGEHRGKALGLVQSAWAIGYALAAAVTATVLPVGGWRAVFFVGVVPALVTPWIWRRVEEPAIWRVRGARPESRQPAIARIFSRFAGSNSSGRHMSVMIEIPSTRMPPWAATSTSGTVDMPTTSAPRPRSIRYSARVSRFGPATAT